MGRIYIYDHESGEVIERTKPSPVRRAAAKWPFACYASGVHASQAQELRDFFQQHGEKVDVTPDGDPVYTGPQQRKRLLKLRGLHDNAAYY
jgi:hypothetical protein